jgi:hypothetical protein
MDHHCPWIGNCVGQHNLKPFILFAVYQAVIGIMYTSQLIPWIFSSPDDTPELSVAGKVCFWLTNVVALPISYGLLPLSINLLSSVYNNITTLERMHNK